MVITGANSSVAAKPHLSYHQLHADQMQFIDEGQPQVKSPVIVLDNNNYNLDACGLGNNGRNNGMII